MFKNIIKQLYSRLIIPYNPQGLQGVGYKEHVARFLKKQYEISDLSDFQNAFSSLIGSIDQPDFPQYVKNVCDPLLAESFIHGLRQIENEQLKMEKVIDDTVQEDVYCCNVFLLCSVDPKKSLFELNQVEMLTKGNLTVASFQADGRFSNDMTILLEMFIRPKINWIIEGQNYTPECYHHVRFLAYHQEEPAGFFKFLYLLQTNSSKKMLLGENPEWKIVDIDYFMKDKYPEIL